MFFKLEQGQMIADISQREDMLTRLDQRLKKTALVVLQQASL